MQGQQYILLSSLGDTYEDWSNTSIFGIEAEKYVESAAKVDWLEILSHYWIFGLLVLLFIIVIIILFISNKKNKNAKERLRKAEANSRLNAVKKQSLDRREKMVSAATKTSTGTAHNSTPNVNNQQTSNTIDSLNF